jgi:AcrR family transcriptional regulator
MAGTEDIRTEDRSMREEQMERTRGRILEALAAEMAERGRDTWSVPDVARRASVAVRTVYRHFPSREALLQGLAERGRKSLEPAELPRSADQIAELCLQEFGRFEADGGLLRALLRSSPGLGSADPRRVEAVRVALAPIVAPLRRGKRLQALALLAHLSSAAAWNGLREQAGPRAGKAAAWAIRTLIQDLRRRARKASRSRSDRKGRRR